MDEMRWLINWFKQHCDGDWEHTYGIKIGTLDNPGWRISISLKETELEKKMFNKLKIERDEDHCFIKNNCFEIACGIYFTVEEYSTVFDFMKEYIIKEKITGKQAVSD